MNILIYLMWVIGFEKEPHTPKQVCIKTSPPLYLTNLCGM